MRFITTAMCILCILGLASLIGANEMARQAKDRGEESREAALHAEELDYNLETIRVEIEPLALKRTALLSASAITATGANPTVAAHRWEQILDSARETNESQEDVAPTRMPRPNIVAAPQGARTSGYREKDRRRQLSMFQMTRHYDDYRTTYEGRNGNRRNALSSRATRRFGNRR